MPAWLLVVVLGLATYRATRLIVADDFPPVRVPREWLAGTDPEHRTGHAPAVVADLITCPWCASGWVALALTAGTEAAGSVPLPVVVWLAVWAIGAWLAHHEREDPGTVNVSMRASARVVNDPAEVTMPPSMDRMLALLREEWGTLGVVNRALEGLTGEARNHVLAAAAEWQSRRVTDETVIRDSDGT